jgi:hypothetical protein
MYFMSGLLKFGVTSDFFDALLTRRAAGTGRQGAPE